MTSTATTLDLAIVCERDGTISRLVHAGSNVLTEAPVHLSDLFAREQVSYIRSFIATLVSDDVAVSDSVLLAQDPPAAIRLIGMAVEGKLYVLGRCVDAAPAPDDHSGTPESLARQYDALIRRDRARNTFLGMAAHELRNPLHTLIGYADMLEDELAERVNPDQAYMLSSIRTTGQEMLTIVDAFLDVATIEAGRLTLSLQVEDLAALVAERAAAAQEAAGRKQITLEAEADGPLLVMLDGCRMRQAIDNLVSNAIKFSNRGAHVHIRVGRTSEYAFVCIEDNGPGIPANEQQNLFRAFGRTSVKSSEGERTVGLGLNIARHIVEAHNGTVGVDSVVGRGSTFTIRLPLQAEDHIKPNAST